MRERERERERTRERERERERERGINTVGSDRVDDIPARNTVPRRPRDRAPLINRA